MRWMFTGPSSSTRVSHHCAISSAWRLVSDAENRHPDCRCKRRGRHGSSSLWWSSPSASIAAFGGPILASGTPEISRFCQTVSRMSPSPRLLRDRGDAAHLRRGHLADRQDDADPVETVPASAGECRYGHARSKGRPRLDRICRYLCQFAAKLLFDTSEVFFEAPGIEHVFQPRLVAVGAIAVLDVDADYGIGDLRRFFRL